MFYNLGIIIGIIFFTPIFGLTGLALGVLLGASMHLAIQVVPGIISGFHWKPVLQLNHPVIRQAFVLMAPRAIGAAAFHINLIVITALASTLATGSIAVFYFANNLQSVPISLVGISLAVASFASLSRLSASEDREGFKESLSFGLRYIMVLIVPISLLMFLLRAHIVRFLLGTGEFGWEATRLTAASLGVFSFYCFALIVFLFSFCYTDFNLYF